MGALAKRIARSNEEGVGIVPVRRGRSQRSDESRDGGSDDDERAILGGEMTHDGVPAVKREPEKRASTSVGEARVGSE
jgi:hypothetical protein